MTVDLHNWRTPSVVALLVLLSACGVHSSRTTGDSVVVPTASIPSTDPSAQQPAQSAVEPTATGTATSPVDPISRWVEHDLGPFTGNQVAAVEHNGELHIIDGRTVLRSWTPSSGEPPPARPLPQPFTPSGPPVVGWQADIVVGQTYRFPMGTHCGIDFLGEFNGKTWWIEGAPTNTYHPADGTLLGEIVVIANDSIEYRVDGELVATYRSSDQEPTYCD